MNFYFVRSNTKFLLLWQHKKACTMTTYLIIGTQYLYSMGYLELIICNSFGLTCFNHYTNSNSNNFRICLHIFNRLNQCWSQGVGSAVANLTPFPAPCILIWGKILYKCFNIYIGFFLKVCNKGLEIKKISGMRNESAFLAKKGLSSSLNI